MKSTDEKIKDVNDVLERIEVDRENVKEIFTIHFTYDGRVEANYAGNWHSLAIAAAFMLRDFDRYAGATE